MHTSFQTLDDVFKEYFPTLVPELSSDSDSGDSADESPNNSDEAAEHDHILDYIRSSQEESTLFFYLHQLPRNLYTNFTQKAVPVLHSGLLN